MYISYTLSRFITVVGVFIVHYCVVCAPFLRYTCIILVEISSTTLDYIALGKIGDCTQISETASFGQLQVLCATRTVFRGAMLLLP